MKETTYSLDELRQICGDNRADIREFIDLFVQTMGPSIDEMRDYASKTNKAGLTEVLHRIRPSVQIFGMKEVLAEMKALEDIFRTTATPADLFRLENLLKQLEAVCARLSVEVKNFG